MATKIAHAYPGQGAQFPEMGKYLSRKALQIATESFQKLITALENKIKKYSQKQNSYSLLFT